MALAGSISTTSGGSESVKGTSRWWSTGLLNKDPGSDKAVQPEAGGELELGNLLGKKAAGT